jgi:hypothetical protein
MSAKATKIMLCLVLCFGIHLNETQAQVLLNTGKIGVRLSHAGSIRLLAPSTSGSRQLDRINIIAALSEQAVCDYNEDQDSVRSAYQVTTPTLSDFEAVAVYDNWYSNLPPDVTFKVHVYAWNDKPYLIARYTVINDSSKEVTLYLGVLTVPRIAGNYGGETNKYNAEHRIAYCYREGEAPHAGFRLLAQDPYSYHALDWLDYSPADPNADAATDSTRYHMTADSGFDTTMTAGGDGSIYSLNAGAYTIAAGDSVSLTYAIAYAELESELFAAADSAQKKYDNVLVSVEKSVASNVSESFSLGQNYPNPFNPTTAIQFDLSKNSNVKLAVYNLQGQLVNVIASGDFKAGSHLANWNGKDSYGREVGSGIYIYRLNADNVTLNKKMLLVR